MTTGTTIVDSRFAVTAPYPSCSGGSVPSTGLIGHYKKKVWSGGNSPTQQVVSPRPFIEVSYPYYDKEGRVVRVHKRKLYTPRQKRSPSKFSQWNTYDVNVNLRDDTRGSRQVYCESPTKRYLDVPTWSSDKPQYAAPKQNALWTSEEDLAMYGKLACRLGTGFDLATFLGEGRESLRTITESSTRIYKAIRAARKGNWLKAWNSLRGTRTAKKVPHYVRIEPGKNRKNFADNWLQLQYGWMPLLNDIFDAAKHLAYTQNRDFTREYRMRHMKGWAGEEKFSPGSTQSFGGSASIKVTWRARITAIDQAMILGLSDPRATAWELVPFSFIVDWFIPLGNYLDALKMRNAISGTYLYSWKRETVTTVYRLSAPPPSELENTYYNVTDIGAGRRIGSALPKPQLPTVKTLADSFSLKRAANAVALIISQALK